MKEINNTFLLLHYNFRMLECSIRMGVEEERQQGKHVLFFSKERATQWTGETGGYIYFIVHEILGFFFSDLLAPCQTQDLCLQNMCIKVLVLVESRAQNAEPSPSSPFEISPVVSYNF